MGRVDSVNTFNPRTHVKETESEIGETTTIPESPPQDIQKKGEYGIATETFS